MSSMYLGIHPSRTCHDDHTLEKSTLSVEKNELSASQQNHLVLPVPVGSANPGPRCYHVVHIVSNFRTWMALHASPMHPVVVALKSLRTSSSDCFWGDFSSCNKQLTLSNSANGLINQQSAYYKQVFMEKLAMERGRDELLYAFEDTFYFCMM